jgi:hypothetical protein
MIWVPLAVAVTGLAALVYGAVQQDLRQSANDPQAQLAEDAAARLDAGAAPDEVVPTGTVDMAVSLAPYVIVFDANARQVASSAQLHGSAPPFPASVMDAVRARGAEAITWQPESGVRSAVVVEPWRGGFVVAGRSLRLIEEREDHILLLSGGMWLLTLAATACAALLVGFIAAVRDGEIDPSQFHRVPFSVTRRV